MLQERVFRMYLCGEDDNSLIGVVRTGWNRNDIFMKRKSVCSNEKVRHINRRWTTGVKNEFILELRYILFVLFGSDVCIFIV